MAARYVTSALLIGSWFALAGCQPAPQPTQSIIVTRMPEPNFRGPDLDVQPAPKPIAPPPPVVTVLPPLPQPAKPERGVPRDWVPVAPANTWTWIVIHHSATPTGGAVAFDKMHRAKGWDELGYHFVVGNGTDTRDGQVEVGSRWPKQKWGAHAKTPDNRFNEHGIGICLVGNFDVNRPSEAQMKSVAKLVAYLMKTYHIRADHVLGHGDTKATDCPGRYMSVARVRQLTATLLAQSGDVVETDAHASATNLLVDVPHVK